MISQPISASTPEIPEIKTGLPEIPSLNQFDMIPAVTTKFKQWAMDIFDVLIQDARLEANSGLMEACMEIIPELYQTCGSVISRHNIQLAVSEHVRKENSAIKLSRTLNALEELGRSIDQYSASLEVPEKIEGSKLPLTADSERQLKKLATTVMLRDLKALRIKQALRDPEIRSKIAEIIPDSDPKIGYPRAANHFACQVKQLKESTDLDVLQAIQEKLTQLTKNIAEPAALAKPEVVGTTRVSSRSGKTPTLRSSTRNSRGLESSLYFTEPEVSPVNTHQLRSILSFPEETEAISSLGFGFNCLGKDAFAATKHTVSDWADLPEDQMLGILNQHCDFHPRSRIYNTHLLAFIPEELDQQALTMSSTLDIIKPDFFYGFPKEVRGEIVLPDIICKDEAFFRSKTTKGHWILMPLEVPKHNQFENYEVVDAREALIVASLYQRYANREIFGGKIGCTSDIISTDMGKKFIAIGSNRGKLFINAFSEEQINSPLFIRGGWALKRKLPFL